MSEILERVARAIEPSTFELPRLELYKADYDRAFMRARAAIEAIREPTGDMVIAAMIAAVTLENKGIEYAPSQGWRAMIDEILK
jgi:hypothetical protein